MADQVNQGVQVELPKPEDDKPRMGRVAAIAAVGLLVGLVWPTLAGVHIGPHVPGAKKAGNKPKAAAVAPSSAASAGASSASSAPPTMAKLDNAPTHSNKQRVVVGKPRIAACFKKRDKVDGDCGVLRADRHLAPRLRELAGCASALGLAGELEIGFDINFRGKEVAVVKGKKSKLPSSTVRGILSCAADYVRDVSLEKIPHKYPRYKVYYTLTFYPPGTAIPQAGDVSSAAAGESDQRGLAAVSWDTALVRSEPRTGDVVARLVRGTRVKILSRRKDWYRVTVRSKEGWIYRGALGL